jgi:hypothetical protein
VLTAHPAKFDEACARARIPPATHPTVEALRKRPSRFSWLRAPAGGEDKLAAWAAAVKRAVEEAAARRGATMPASRL